jgi:hypothetical protein
VELMGATCELDTLFEVVNDVETTMADQGLGNTRPRSISRMRLNAMTQKLPLLRYLHIYFSSAINALEEDLVVDYNAQSIMPLSIKSLN